MGISVFSEAARRFGGVFPARSIGESWARAWNDMRIFLFLPIIVRRSTLACFSNVFRTIERPRTKTAAPV
jgi:hypothetical protein